MAPYNAQVGAILRELPERPGRHRRQVPGAGGAGQHLLDDVAARRRTRRAAWTSSTRATGSTWRRRAPDASPSSWPSPALLRVRARTPEQMRLANALCQFAELSGAAGEPAGRPRPISRSPRSRPSSEDGAASAIGASQRLGDHRGVLLVEVADELVISGVPAFLGGRDRRGPQDRALDTGCPT